jgi:hypothetical protein
VRAEHAHEGQCKNCASHGERVCERERERERGDVAVQRRLLALWAAVVALVLPQKGPAAGALLGCSPTGALNVASDIQHSIARHTSLTQQSCARATSRESSWQLLVVELDVSADSRLLIAALIFHRPEGTMEAFISPLNLVKVRLQVDPNLREQSLLRAFRTVRMICLRHISFGLPLLGHAEGGWFPYSV